MNSFNPIDMQEKRTKSRPSSRLTRRNILIFLMSSLIVIVMGAWLAFLGWGLLETARAAEKFLATFF